MHNVIAMRYIVDTEYTFIITGCTGNIGTVTKLQYAHTHTRQWLVIDSITHHSSHTNTLCYRCKRH